MPKKSVTMGGEHYVAHISWERGSRHVSHRKSQYLRRRSFCDHIRNMDTRYFDSSNWRWLAARKRRILL
jgi:hypothetical protein